MEAETVNGISVQKIYFQPDVDLSPATSQIIAATNYIRALLPAGTQPPAVVQSVCARLKYHLVAVLDAGVDLGTP